ncbi:MAG: hypothetical protein MUF01_06670 [Bryobacterales bacterium]|jgi:hypothetical protein|nr:hypothetical protein [Bryobacterales bacterium]
MPKKRRRILSATTEVKRLARERVGPVPPSRVEDNRRPKRQEKHKQDWRDWVSKGDSE